ncbi:hypothetical protein [uncultured Chryseobacterium sp.]|uniref:hypothetical protein n=1 Tax=uncultured Chryseobacterium sp. TaxID=259322 RepID=UPI0025D3F72D|nr:hypothetical protein [uncultured Chryseobacterium sp.]
MSPSKLSLLATFIHIFLLFILFKFDETLFIHDWENAVMSLIFLLVILALILAVVSRKTTLGAVLMVVNGIYMLICLFMVYFIINFTFKV